MTALIKLLSWNSGSEFLSPDWELPAVPRGLSASAPDAAISSPAGPGPAVELAGHVRKLN